MHWRVEDVLHRWGPKAVMLGSMGFVGALLFSSPGARVPAFADADAVRVSSLESARVLEVRVQPGDLVEPGDVLAVLDDGPIAGRVAMLEAELHRQGAELIDVEQDAQATLLSAKASLVEAQTQLNSASGVARLASERLADQQKQVTAGLATTTTLAPLRAGAAEAQAEVSRLRARVNFLKQAAGAANARLDSGDAPAPALQAQTQAAAVVAEELAMLQRRREALTLRSPVTARVATVSYRTGEVLPAEAVLAELLPTSTLGATACLPEQLAGFVRAGTPVLLEPTDGTADRQGTVVEVIHQISRAPDRCQQRPNEFGWIRPVRIAVDGEGFVPGQRLSAIFLPLEDGT